MWCGRPSPQCVDNSKGTKQTHPFCSCAICFFCKLQTVQLNIGMPFGKAAWSSGYDSHVLCGRSRVRSPEQPFCFSIALFCRAPAESTQQLSRAVVAVFARWLNFFGANASEQLRLCTLHRSFALPKQWKCTAAWHGAWKHKAFIRGKLAPQLSKQIHQSARRCKTSSVQ